VRALALLLVSLVTVGCTSSESGLRLGTDAPPPDPYYQEYRELLAGEHHKDFPLPVEQPARTVLVTVALQTRDQGLPLPDASPASLRITILAPDGTPLQEADLDAQHTHATLALTDVGPGRYLARADGFGASQDLDEKPYGAEYVLSAEILYE
jgi:hypothetical protein